MSLDASPHLSLKRNSGEDPFLRTDFVSNWDKIDLAPGIHICTYGTRPTWGPAQAGRTILETDTGRELVWTVTGGVGTWREQVVAPAIWYFGKTYPSGRNGTWYEIMGNVVLKRPSAIMTINSVRCGAAANKSPSVYFHPFIAGNPCDLPTNRDGALLSWDATNASSANVMDQRSTTFYGLSPVLPAGTHEIKIQGATIGTDTISMGTVSTIAMAVSTVGLDGFGLSV